MCRYFGLLLLGLLIFAGCASRQQKASPRTDKFDQEFLQWMGNHLIGDLRIARTCKGKNIRPELADFCSTLFADQSGEQARLAGMMKQWYGKEFRKDLYPLWLESQDGKVFEEKFLEGVLRDHTAGAERARECTARAKHPELAQFCQEVAAHRTAEAVRMKKWNCAWFGHC